MTKKFAVLQNNNVINIIVANTKEIAEEVTKETCVECPNEILATIGWTYNGSTFEEPIKE
jgi:hypothetical protein